MLNIRKAEEKDISTVQKLGHQLLEAERKGWDPTLDTKWALSEAGTKMYQDAIKNKYVILAEVDDVAVGYLIGNISYPPEGSARHIVQARIANIYVDDAHRRQGIGKQLFQYFKEYCLKKSVDDLEVPVLAKNVNAIKFYENIGFSPKRISMSQKLQ